VYIRFTTAFAVASVVMLYVIHNSIEHTRDVFVQTSDVSTRASQHCGKRRKRPLPTSTDREMVRHKKFDVEVQQSTARISDFGGSATAIWVTSQCYHYRDTVKVHYEHLSST